MHNDDDEMDDEDVSEDRSNKVCPGLCDQPRHGLIPLGKPKVRWLVGLGGYGLRFINREEELYWRFHHCSHSSSPWETPGKEEGSPNTQFAQFSWAILASVREILFECYEAVSNSFHETFEALDQEKTLFSDLPENSRSSAHQHIGRVGHGSVQGGNLYI